MAIMYLFFVFSMIIVRFLAGYDSRFQSSRYIVINSRKLRMLLIDEMSFFERRKRLKKDINKMTVSGLVFYIFGLLVLIESIVLLWLVPKFPIEPWEIETSEFYMYADTLNEKLSAICIWLFYLSVIWCVAARMIKFIKTIEQKWLKIFTHLISVIMFAVVTLMVFYMVKELAMCFI